MKTKILKEPPEIFYKEELKALAKWDKGNPKPQNWLLSPKAVMLFILGSKDPIKSDKKELIITKKFYGDDQLVQRAIVTLAGNRGLMLVGEPGTAKTMLSELLSAAISGTSNNTIQGTAGTTEDMVKYSWNYGLLLAKGPSKESLIPSPILNGMENGIITRVEEITRCAQEIQDALISILSDKVLNIPELGEEGVIYGKPGFNIIATANLRDKGVNSMSSALKRRFNFETIQPIKSLKLEMEIIENQSKNILSASGIEADVDRDVAEILATTFRDLREGTTTEGYKVEKLNATMSTAEAVSVYVQTALSSYYFKEGTISMDYLVQNILGTVIKDEPEDGKKLLSYFNSIIKRRAEREDSLWKEFYDGRVWIK